MGWGNCGTDSKGRPIGYGFEATCDHPGCGEKIDRGLAFACGGMHGEEDMDGNHACDGYFCPAHLRVPAVEESHPPVCFACAEEIERAEAKLDEEWAG